MVRLYPVPFRMIEDGRQFKKWQWIDVVVQRAHDDRRSESHRIYVDTITLGDVLTRAQDWSERRHWLGQIPTYLDFDALEHVRASTGSPTLAIVKPSRILGLDIKEVDRPNWTDQEKDKLLQLQRQGNLFEVTDREIRMLRKIPFDFHYRYECTSENGSTKVYRHKLVDWEVGALFWNVWHKHGPEWEGPFRQKIERELASRDLALLLGTIHRFPDQWLIVSLFYPPKVSSEGSSQASLF